MRSFVKRQQSQVSWERSLVVDLDDTICVADKTEADPIVKYSNALPIKPIINKLKQYHSDGWYITIHTARHMVTCNNDADIAYGRLGPVTVEWLDKHKVPYDQVVFGKPYGKFYIDDKALSLKDFLND